MFRSVYRSSFGLLLYEHAFYNESIAIFNIALNLAHQDPVTSSQIIIYIGFAQHNVQSVQAASDSLYQAAQTFATRGVFNSLLNHQKTITEEDTIISSEKFDAMLTSNAAIFGAMLLENQFKFEKSIQMLEIAYQIDFQLLGNHIKTRITLSNIARMYSKLGDATRAVEYKMRSVGTDDGMTGVYNLHLPQNMSHLERKVCTNDSFNEMNETISLLNIQQNMEKHTFNGPTQMTYGLKQTILDWKKVWKQEFDLFSSSASDHVSISNSLQMLLNITLLTTQEPIQNSHHRSEIRIPSLSCQPDKNKVSNLISHEIEFPYGKTHSNATLMRYTDKIDKYISKLQKSHGESINISIMKYILGQLHMANDKYWTGLKHHKEAFALLVKQNILPKRKKWYAKKKRLETLHDHIIGSILLYGAHPRLYNVSVKELNKALQYHKLLGNKLEESQILIGLANAKKDDNHFEAFQLFNQATMQSNYWTLSTYFRLFLSENNHRKFEARQAYEYGKLACKLGHPECRYLMKTAVNISTTAVYITNCEPVLFHYAVLSPTPHLYYLDFQNTTKI